MLLKSRIKDSILILGESGVGKTSIVRQVAAEIDYGVWDVRWGSLMPADARGVPVSRHPTPEELVADQTAVGYTVFYPPKFWPRRGPGIIFLDEYNMANATMMGLGQQLLLDGRFGDYEVPPDVLVWAAGNRKIDRAAVSEIPGPTNNRVAHYEVEHDLPSFEQWAYPAGVDVRILGFLKWRSELLHKFNPDARAWPSPRTWEMADRRLKAGMGIWPVVGQDASDEFEAFLRMLKHLPNIEAIVRGAGASVPFPKEPSIKYATMAELTQRSLATYDSFIHSFRWAIDKNKDEPDWTSFFAQDYVRLLKTTKPQDARRVLPLLLQLPDLRRFVTEQAAIGGLT